MNLNEYQQKAAEYKSPSCPPEERVMGIMEEAGEVAGVFKRLLRGDYTPDQAATRLHKELGDVLWYVSQVALDNGWTLQEIAEANLDKLQGRKIRQTILGEGDLR